MATKNKTQKLVPELRFPEFREDGAWEEKPLHRLSKRLRRKVGTKKLTPVSITAGVGFVDQTKKFGRRIAGEQYKNYIHIVRGDFVYNKGNSKTFAQGCIYQLKEFEEAAASTAFICFKLNDDCVDQYFQSLFECNTHGRKLQKFITSGARSDGLLNISPTDFFSIELPLPPRKPEQQKIADCLGSLDELLAAHRRKLAALQDHKKGLLQQLFPKVEGASSSPTEEQGEQDAPATSQTTPTLRFPGFTDQWEEKRLPEMSDNLNNRRVPITSTERVKGTIPYYGATGIIDYVDGYIFDEDLLCISEDGANLVARTYPIAFTISGKTWVNNHAHVLRFREACTRIFVEAFLNHTKLDDFLTGMAQPKLNREKLDSIPVPIPTLPEQQKIADCLSALDALIAAQTEQITALQAHKQGLMQQLFPTPENTP